MDNTRLISEETFWISVEAPDIERVHTHKNAWENRIATEDQHSLVEDEGGVMLLKKAFTVNGVKKASVKASALGCFDIWCNGARVGTTVGDSVIYDEMKPGWTDYRKRALVYEYDLTPFLADGENLIVAALSGGWWCGKIAVNTYGAARPAFICEIELEDEA